MGSDEDAAPDVLGYDALFPSVDDLDSELILIS